MDGLPPPERPLATLRPIAGGGALRVQSNQPLAPAGAQWLSEFLRREGIPEDRTSPIPIDFDDEPAQKSYRGRALITIGVVLAIALAGVFAPRRVVLAYYERWSAAAAVALHLSAPQPHPAAPAHPAAPVSAPLPAATAMAQPPAPDRHATAPASPPPLPNLPLAVSPPAPAPIKPHQEMLSPLGDPATGFSNFPQQPVDPPPTVLSNWAGALVIPTPLAGTPAVPASAPSSAPPAVSPVVTRPAVPGAFTLPTGTPVTLRIVYTPADPAAASRIDALAKRLSSQVASIASVTAFAGPASYASVVYYFPSDRAAAGRIAASLARMTRRPEPLLLVHANPLPRPGTIEIRLPLRNGKEPNNAAY